MITAPAGMTIATSYYPISYTNLKLQEEKKVEKERSMTCFCSEDFVEHDFIVVHGKDKLHPAHQKCIKVWIEKTQSKIPSCPVCRNRVDLKSLFTDHEITVLKIKNRLKILLPLAAYILIAEKVTTVVGFSMGLALGGVLVGFATTHAAMNSKMRQKAYEITKLLFFSTPAMFFTSYAVLNSSIIFGVIALTLASKAGSELVVFPLAFAAVSTAIVGISAPIFTLYMISGMLANFVYNRRGGV